MDSVTQACLGAAVAGAVMPRLGRPALVLGAALGTLPDMDVLIDYGDAVANFTRHRGFSHSLFVLTGLATLLALGASRWSRTRSIAGFSHWWWLFALCLLTHPILDAFTTYGTQLFWPLPLEPVSWDNLPIIDPAYTLPLLVGVLAFARRPTRHRWLVSVLALSSIYIVFTFAAQAHVTSRARAALAARGLADAPLLVQPVPLTTLLWRVTAIDGDDAQEAWISLFDGRAPVRFTRWPLGAEAREIALDTVDGQRLAWFCGPFIRYRIETAPTGNEALVATDIRLLVPRAHPFVFTLARRGAGEPWHAIRSERRDAERIYFETVRRLLARVISPRVDPIEAP